MSLRPTKFSSEEVKRLAAEYVKNSPTGCVFCDLDIEPVNGEHECKGERIPCQRRAHGEQLPQQQDKG